MKVKFQICKTGAEKGLGREADGRFVPKNSAAAAARQLEAIARRQAEQRRMVAEAMEYGRTTVDAVVEYVLDMCGACQMSDDEIAQLIAQ